MIIMDIKAPLIEKAKESTTMIEISLSGDTYPIKDRIKELGFRWDRDSEWYYTTDRKWFKENSYQFVRSLAKEFGLRASNINVIGDQAKIAVKTMDK